MPAGFEVTTPSGEVVSYTNRRPARVIGTFIVSTSSGNYTVPGVTGRLFAYVQVDKHYTSLSNDQGFAIGHLNVNGSTVSWSWITPSRLPFIVVVGECGL